LLKRFPILITFAAALLGASPDPDPRDRQGEAIVERYLAASQAQQEKMRGVQMEVDILARLPRLGKSGTMHALRSISRLGEITYNAFKFSGDSTVKKDVIARYLTAENEQRDPAQLAITPRNYKFKYKGLDEKNGREVHVLHLTPRRKEVGLFKGEIWLDPDTCMPVREQGRFVKSPSVFLKKVEFVREYEIRDGIAYPRHIQSVVDTRLVGKAELDINFSNFARLFEATASSSFDQ
jgi:hypothetical protein